MQEIKSTAFTFDMIVMLALGTTFFGLIVYGIIKIALA